MTKKKAQPTIKERKQAVANLLGMDEGRIHEMSLQLSSLRNEGVLLDLNITGVSKFERTLTWAELGIQAEENDVRYRHFTRGRKYVIPEAKPRKLKSLVSQIRQRFEHYTFVVSGFGNFRWLSYKAYPKFREEYLSLVDQFNAVKAEIIDEHESYVAQVTAIYEAVAESAWKAIQGQGYQHLIIKGKAYSSLEEVTEKIVGDVVELIPTIEEIERDLQVDYVTAIAFGVEEAARQQAEAEKIQAKASVVIEREHLRNEAERERVRHERRSHQMEEDAKSEQISEMQRIETEHYRQQLQTIASPYEQVLQAFRVRMSDLAENALKSVNKWGFVRGKVAESIMGMMELNAIMNSHNDRELSDKMERLKVALGPVGEERDKNPVKRESSQVASALEEIMNLAKGQGRSFAAGPDMFALLEVDENEVTV